MFHCVYSEIRQATGDLQAVDECSEVILFTLDDKILNPIAEHDELAGKIDSCGLIYRNVSP